MCPSPYAFKHNSSAFISCYDKNKFPFKTRKKVVTSKPKLSAVICLEMLLVTICFLLQIHSTTYVLMWIIPKYCTDKATSKSYDALHDLIPSSLFKNVKKPWRSATFSTVANFSLNFTKGIAPPWVFSRFLNCRYGTKPQSVSDTIVS